MVLSLLEDGVPRHVRKITSEISQKTGKKQKKDSINVACSKLHLRGVLARPLKGVYQRA